MLDHLAIQCADAAASAAFYDQVLAPVGGTRVIDFGEVIGYGSTNSPRPDFWLGPLPAGAGFRESHIAFTAPSRAAVRAFFHAAVDAGAEVPHRPRLRPEYDPAYYGVFVRDPDGNNVEAVCREPEQRRAVLESTPRSGGAGSPERVFGCRALCALHSGDGRRTDESARQEFSRRPDRFFR